jgi:hypothetical protein
MLWRNVTSIVYGSLGQHVPKTNLNNPSAKREKYEWLNHHKPCRGIQIKLSWAVGNCCAWPSAWSKVASDSSQLVVETILNTKKHPLLLSIETG